MISLREDKMNKEKKKANEKSRISPQALHYHNTPEVEEKKYPFKAGEGKLGSPRQKSRRIDSSLGKHSLTEKQALVLQFVADHVDQVGFPPTVRQVAEYFAISGKAAHDHLRAVAKKNYLRLFPGSARGMELLRLPDGSSPYVDRVSQVDLEDVIMIPLVGSIAAGQPILAEENVQEHLSFPASFLPSSGEMFALRIKGDSMEDAGIFEGDIAVVKKIVSPDIELQNGDIVAALIDDNATLKTYKKVKKSVQLHPENNRYKVIHLNEQSFSSIMGKLVGVYRSYR